MVFNVLWSEDGQGGGATLSGQVTFDPAPVNCFGGDSLAACNIIAISLTSSEGGVTESFTEADFISGYFDDVSQVDLSTELIDQVGFFTFALFPSDPSVTPDAIDPRDVLLPSGTVVYLTSMVAIKEFSLFASTSNASSGQAAALGDLNDDNLPDLFWVNTNGQPNQVALNTSNSGTDGFALVNPAGLGSENS
jgi:hypothetical protein